MKADAQLTAHRRTEDSPEINFTTVVIEPTENCPPRADKRRCAFQHNPQFHMNQIGSFQHIGAAVSFLLAIRIDEALIKFVNANTSPALDHAFDSFSELANAKLAIVTGFTLYFLGHLTLARRSTLLLGVARGEHLVRGGVLMLLTLLTGAVITWLLKYGVARARPKMLIEQSFNGFGFPFSGAPFNSFPSSHAFTAFAIAAVLGKFHPPIRTPMLLLALAVAACRVLTLEHYLTDVMFSALIAYGCAQSWSVRVMDPQASWPLQRPWGRQATQP